MTAFLLALAGLAAGMFIGIAVGRRRAGRHVILEQPDLAAPDEVGAVLRDAVDELDLGVVVADRSGRIVYRNASASGMAGTHAGVIVDDHLGRLIARARSGRSADEELQLSGPPKMTLLLRADVTPDGAAVATIEDISERVRTEAMRRDFVANISHELKTPVGAIAVLAEALVDESDVDVVRRVAGRMIDESHRAVEAIDDLLELSWIEVAARTDEVVGLRGVVSAAIARAQVADAGREVTVTTFEPAEEVHLRADERQLVSALGNLVENAVKYSHDGGEVQVRTLVSGTAVEIMVVDHGIGIPARDLDRVFERFYRVDKARRRSTGGTGLGLSIVRHVATNHGGEVLVSSREGEGSSFVFRLPAELVVDAVPHDREAAVSTGPATGGTRTDPEDQDMADVRQSASEGTRDG